MLTGSEGCETRWEHADRTWNKCKAAFADHKMDFESLWSDSDRSVAHSVLESMTTPSSSGGGGRHMYDSDGRMLSAKQLTAVEVITNCTTLWEIYEKQWEKLDKTLLYKPRYFKRVFIVQNQWDYNYHHFLAESLSRLIRNVKFLRANPDIYIHIRAMENYDTVPLREEKFKQVSCVCSNFQCA